MADIGKALFHKVTNTAGVSSLISTRFYPVVVPQTATFPLAVYQSISGGSIKTHGEPSSLPRPRYQITAWALTFAEVVAIDNAIKTAIDGKRETWGTGAFATVVHECSPDNEPRDDRDPVTGLYTRSRDYFIRYK